MTESAQPYLLPLSAPTAEELSSAAEALKAFLASPEGRLPLRDLCYTASVFQSHHDHRLALAFHSREELMEQLTAFGNWEIRPGMRGGHKDLRQPPKVALVFCGQGAHWWGMGKALLAQEPAFRSVIEECDKLLQGRADWRLLEVLEAARPEWSQKMLESMEIARPALFAVQAGLCALWRSWGLRADGLVGHSNGEVAAAYVSGSLSLEEAVLAAHHGGRATQRGAGLGRMAAVDWTLERAREALRGREGRLSIAALNGPQSVILSGDADALEEALTSAPEAERPEFQMLRGGFPFHSALMAPFSDELAASLSGLAPKTPAIPVYSTVHGEQSRAGDFGASYWARSIRESVRFGPAVERMIDAGFNTFVEVGPQPVLRSHVIRYLERKEKEGLVVPSLRHGQDERFVMLCSLGALYTRGCPVDWKGLYPAGRRIRLPGREWSRSAAPAPVQGSEHPLLGAARESARAREWSWETVLAENSPGFLADHKVQGFTVLPGVAYAGMALDAAGAAFGAAPLAAEEVLFKQPLVLSEGGALRTQTALFEEADGSRSFEVWSRPAAAAAAWTLHASGRLREAAEARPAPESLHEIQERCPDTLAGDVHYAVKERQGFQYGPYFRNIEKIYRRDGEALARLRWPESRDAESTRYRAHPALLDNCVHFAVHALPKAVVDSLGYGSYIPARLGRLRIWERPSGTLWSHVVLKDRAETGEDAFEGDVRVLGENGEVLLELSGWRYKRLAGKPSAASRADAAMRERLDACAAAEERRAMIEAYLVERLAETLGLPLIDARRPLIDLGLDSMLAVEVKNRAEIELGLRVSVVGMLSGLSAAQFSAKLAEQWVSGSSAREAAPAAGAALDQFSDQEVEAMLEAMLAQGAKP